jgi:hypothetical protein
MGKKAEQMATTASAAEETIEFQAACVEGKAILGKIEEAERGQLRLGELAHKVVHPTYGDRTMAKFAEALGISKCTLDRYRTVYRAYAGILAPGAKIEIPPYTVLRELAPHQNCAQIIKDKPNLTKREAQAIMRKHRGTEEEKQKEEKQKQTQEEEWFKHKRKWFRDLYNKAEEASRAAEAVLNSTQSNCTT